MNGCDRFFFLSQWMLIKTETGSHGSIYATINLCHLCKLCRREHFFCHTTHEKCLSLVVSGSSNSRTFLFWFIFIPYMLAIVLSLQASSCSRAYTVTIAPFQPSLSASVTSQSSWVYNLPTRMQECEAKALVRHRIFSSTLGLLIAKGSNLRRSQVNMWIKDKPCMVSASGRIWGGLYNEKEKIWTLCVQRR